MKKKKNMGMEIDNIFFFLFEDRKEDTSKESIQNKSITKERKMLKKKRKWRNREDGYGIQNNIVDGLGVQVKVLEKRRWKRIEDEEKKLYSRERNIKRRCKNY